MYESYQLIVSDWDREKIQDFHGVSEIEVEEALTNSLEPYPLDGRSKQP